ncbi:MAG: hypothetical protein EOM67_03675 [Spirochaetia bacterium]|nr:hypothetical protein [Spirochaetia bacterium]
MKDFVVKDFGKLLKRNALETRRVMKEFDTNVMRVYNLNLEELPVTVDMYASYARITDYSDIAFSDEDEKLICDIVSRYLYVEPDKVIYHKREKREKGEQHTTLQDESLLVNVRENGLSFIVDLTKRIDTGLFLDQMITRKSLMESCKDLDVLNLFSYTGAFSVYAAAGGAKSVVSVDLSSTYSDWCEKNLAENGFSGEQYKVVTMDALSFIAAEKLSGKKYDIIIFDPPSFSNSRKMEKDFDVQRDYLSLIKSMHALLVSKGTLLFSTNLSSFKFDKHRIQGYQVREITKENAAPGFSVKKNSLRSWILEKKQEGTAPENLQVENEDISLKKKSKKATPEKVQGENEDISKTKKGKKIAPIIDLSTEDEQDAELDKFLHEELLSEDDDMDIEEDVDDESEDDDDFDAEEETDEDIDADKEFDEDIITDENQSDESKNTKQRRYERRHPGEVATPRAAKEKSKETYPKERESSKQEGALFIDDLQWDTDSAPKRSFERPQGDSRDNRGQERRPYNDRNDNRGAGGERSFDRDRKPFDRERRPYNDRNDSRGSEGRSFDRDRKPFDRERRPYNDRNDSRGGERSFDRDRKPFDRERRPYNDRNDSRGGERSFDRDRKPFDRDRKPFDRERRPFNDRSDNRGSDGERSFDRDRKPFDRDRKPFDRERRPYNDRNDSRGGERSFDRDRKPFDRERRPFNDRNDSRGSEGRSFDRDRKPFDRERRPFNDRNDSRGGERSFDRDRKPFDRERRPFNDRNDSRGGGERSFNSERKPFDRGSAPSRPRGEKSRPKPYGFDRFSNSRSRESENDRKDSEE